MLEICKLYKDLKPKLVILFGSYARGDYTNESDIDVLVVSDNLPLDPRESFAITYNPEYPKIMPVAMHTSVFIKKLESGDTFILEILEDGKIICGDEEFIKETLIKYKEVRKKFKREGKVWSW
ncbi:MAG: nucleotidyltransferase domain-containing protein [Thermoproteota archaeon]|jgi:predicted nucleotidyltransferase|nr:nucleotidyltransferase domain-containing protein [Thermoproteota archaeon]